MPYIPEQHKKYNLLPYCRKDGGEVFDYPSDLISKAEKMLLLIRREEKTARGYQICGFGNSRRKLGTKTKRR